MNIKGQFSKLMKTKIAGIPAPIIGVGVAAAAIIIIRRRNAAGSSTASSTPTDTGSTDPGISGAASSGGGYDPGMTGGGGAAGGADYYTPSVLAGPTDGSGLIAASPGGPISNVYRTNIRNIRQVHKKVFVGRVRKTVIVHPRRGQGPLKVPYKHTPPIIRRKAAHHTPAGGAKPVNMRQGKR